MNKTWLDRLFFFLGLSVIVLSIGFIYLTEQYIKHIKFTEYVPMWIVFSTKTCAYLLVILALITVFNLYKLASHRKFKLFIWNALSIVFYIYLMVTMLKPNVIKESSIDLLSLWFNPFV